MGKLVDMTGQVFTWLTVVAHSHTNKSSHWRCKCQCGNEVVVSRSGLLRGDTKSCGCYRRSLDGAVALKRTKHGHGTRNAKSPTYITWCAMRERCQNPNNNEYFRYGAVGITVCDRWQKFENFLEDMGERPSGMSIEREKQGGNYESGNCRWATPTEQNFNRKLYKNRASLEVVRGSLNIHEVMTIKRGVKQIGLTRAEVAYLLVELSITD